ncbi:MAG TPA: hypothetical protein VIE43_02955 [Thermoanaerobaculia bacterium]|jgi:hypothetical protein|nr:hypothetical protein [Thermoanaerobaculia bacterium]
MKTMVCERLAITLLSVTLLGRPGAALAQFIQQGPKLVGTGSAGAGQSPSALSADGNTAMLGGPLLGSADFGAAWIFTRSGGAWSQQGGHLVGADAVGIAAQGTSVALSGDGNTAILAGPGDSDVTGAIWIFVRSGGIWSQQGNKLVGTGTIGAADLGYSVALSADGNTAIAGGPFDNSNVGAAWVFTRSGGVWNQQGSKLVGFGAVGSFLQQGVSVAISADGNTAIVGGNGDSAGTGAAWIYTRSGEVWSQQGKLAGTGGIGMPNQGWSVSLSGDGNTALLGGPYDNSGTGATWVFTRSGGIWSQQGIKLVGRGAVGAANQGWSVALSGDGNLAIASGFTDDSDAGAVWVFARNEGVWSQRGSKLRGTGTVLAAPAQGASVALSADGSTVMIGGPGDNSETGAAWIFAASSADVPTLSLSGLVLLLLLLGTAGWVRVRRARARL